jgi:Tfp pilus assembly protein FimV
MERTAGALVRTAAAGLLLVFAQAAPALEIGALVADSRLGQPLSARVVVSLAAGEALDAGCVTVIDTATGLPAVAGVRATATPAVGPATGSIRLDSPRPLTEPAYGLTVRLACPGMIPTAREFVLMPDLPGTSPAPVPGSVTVASAAEAPSPQSTADNTTFAAAPGGHGATRAAGAPAHDMPPLAPGDRHQVRTGETLWSIAVRATATGGSPSRTAAAIHAANRQAFLAGDPARLMAGATLVIPAGADALRATAPPESGVPTIPATVAAGTDPGEGPGEASLASTGPAGPPDASATDARGASDTGDAPGEPGAVSAPAAAGATPAAAGSLALTEAVVAPAQAPRPRPARQPPAAIPARPPQPAGAEPVVSALAGAVFGLLASSPLWWRSRRRSRIAAAAAAPPAPVKVAVPVAATTEPAIAVSFEPLPASEAPMAVAAVAGSSAGSGTWPQRSEETTRSQHMRTAGDITSELEELFNTAPGEAGGATTSRRPWVPGTGLIDLPALAEGSDTDEHQAQGLRDALALLERDYEQEWTGNRAGPAGSERPAPAAPPRAPIRRLG